MTGLATVSEYFNVLRVCVIIPTYNNAATLGSVINDVSSYTQNIIVVNDGSTDGTTSMLEQFDFVQVLGYPENAGKGWAVRQGFKYAASQQYDFAITIDSDGQHFAKDLPVFIDKLRVIKDAIIIGARDMEQSSVPGKSSFGNKFSNFWFRAETGIDCPDTQSGYRLYPLNLLKDVHFITRRYEFEIEVLVRAAWKDIKIVSVPVSVYYPSKHERVSHFRPFIDFSRISILNTFLVLVSFLYIKPRDFFRAIFQKRKWKELLTEHLFNSFHSDQNKAISVAFGIFMGILPIWGFQLVAAIFLAVILKLNKILVIIAANISIPPMIPVIIFLSYKTGALWLGENALPLEFNHAVTIASIQQNLQQYIYGSVTLAIFAGIVTGLLTFILLKLLKRKCILTG